MNESMPKPWLGNPGRTIAVLNRYRFSLRKKYGQNFLIDSNVLERIVEASGITGEDFVLEIGPGIGTMTQYLARAARKVTAVEIDRALIPILEDTLREFPNVEIVCDDIRRVDLRELVKTANGGNPIQVVANLPYYITTPIIMELLESRSLIDSITVMVQKEVADRMNAEPRCGDYGAFSLAVQYYARPEIITNVSPNCFLPRPAVGSAVVRLIRHPKPPVEVKDEKLLFALIRASFNQRRKTLVNGLKNAGQLAFSREEIEDAVTAIGKSLNVRGEELTLAEFAALANALTEMKP